LVVFKDNFSVLGSLGSVTDTDTEYRTDMKKYRRKYRIPIPTPNTDTDPALVIGPGLALEVSCDQRPRAGQYHWVLGIILYLRTSKFLCCR